MNIYKNHAFLSALLAIFLLSGCLTNNQSLSTLIPGTIISPSNSDSNQSSTSIPEFTASNTLSPSPMSQPSIIPQETPTSIYLPTVTNAFPPKNIFGAALDTITEQDGLIQMRSANSGWVRRDYPWLLAEPQLGQIDLNSSMTSLDQEIINASQNGMNLILILGGTPTWAQDLPGDQCGGRVKQDKLSALADFVKVWVGKYSQAPYNVRYFEFWNEPDVVGGLGCWGNANDAYYGGGYYGEMLKAIYPQVKAANSSAQVLVGGLLFDCDPRSTSTQICPSSSISIQALKEKSSLFLEGILSAGDGAYFDGISFHAYDYYRGEGQYENPNWGSAWNTTGPSSVAKAEYIKEVLTKYQITGKFLINTEVSLLFCGQSRPDLECQANYQSVLVAGEKTKSSYIVQSYALAMEDGLLAGIWWKAVGIRGAELLNSDLSLRDSYKAFTVAQAELLNVKFVSDKVTNGIRVLTFNHGTKQIWIVWSIDGSLKTLAIDRMPSAVYDMMGTNIPASQSITIDWQPNYIEFQN